MLIFLDIDGVMVPAKGWSAPELLTDGFPAFSAKATQALKQLIDRDTIIVLTTSHKSNYSISDWEAIFKNRGIEINALRTLPHNANNLSRRDEIIDWINVHPSDGPFIIIDDDKSLNGLPAHLKERLVQTSPLIGLTDEHVVIANNILKRNRQPV